MQAIRLCNKGTIVDGRVKNPNRTGMNTCNRNFREFMAHCSSQEKIVLDQVAYENKARGVKSVNIQIFCRCNEGTIDDGPVKNPNRAGCYVIKSISGY